MSDSDFRNYFKGKRLRPDARDRRDREGLFRPPTLWKCDCGRRFRGDLAISKHHESPTRLPFCMYAVGVRRGHRG